MKLQKNRRFKPKQLGGFAAGLAGLAFCLVAQASSANWWVDIANDRVENVRNELAQGESPNGVSKNGQPAIMLAIRDGAWRVYDLLAAHRKVDVNAVNKNNETPLMYLAIVGDTKRAQALIKKGAQVNRLGWTPLHYAASKGQTEMVKLLITNKAIVDAPAPDGTTALMMAAFSGSEPVVRELLRAGAEVTTQNLQKQDAADWARSKNHVSLAKKLDDLTRKTLEERAALRARNQVQNANIATDPSNPLGVRTVVVPQTPQPPSDQAQPSIKTDNSGSAKGKSGSSYFDLDRFNKEEPDGQW